MRDAPDAITAFLGRVRAVSRRRRALRWSLDFLLGFAALSAVAVAVTALTSRGDVWGPVGLAALLGAAVGTTYWSVRRRSREDARLLSAREVAGHRGPLAVPPLTPNDDAFRAEILGATELLVSAGGDDARGSSQLSALYVERIGRRLMEAEPRRAVPGVAWRPRMMSAVVLSATWLALLTTPDTAAAFSALLAFEDARPPLPPEPIWSRLELVLEYPTHTGRPSRRVPNPSGALRVPAGTQVKVEFWTQRSEAAARLAVQTQGVDAVNTPDPQLVEMRSDATADAGQRHWEGEFEVVGATTWHALVFEEAGDDEPTARSLELAFELERDAEPEVELEPLPDGAKEASELQTVSLRFTARDDFGLRSAELAYSLSDGTVHRLPAGEPAGDLRRWNHRYDWDLSAIPTDERGLLTYWIEVRDNDPGLGLEPLVDGPGKVGRSARMQLQVRDREREHAQNIESLRAIRDGAVDMLAARLTAQDTYDPPSRVLARAHSAAQGADPDDFESSDAALDTQAIVQYQLAAVMHGLSAELLSQLAGAVDAMSIDPLARERDVRTLAAIHERLLELHRDEGETLDRIPAGGEFDAGRAALERSLARLNKHNFKEQAQLEDEIIRLDDLVDGELMRELETLSARLEASQQKLVELLEALKAGDESVRPQIEQLQERIREDMRRFQEARQKLSKEVGDEFFNRDAFANLEKMMERQDTMQALRDGDIDRALQQAKESLAQMQGVNDAVQERLAEGGEESRLDPEEEARMKLLRELSRLQDAQTGLTERARELDDAWRNAVSATELDRKAGDAKKRADQLLEELGEVNDARLSREGRERFEDAREALQKLSEAASEAQESPKALPQWDAARDARRALEDAKRGVPKDSRAAKQLDKLANEAERLESSLGAPLPSPEQTLDESMRGRAAESTETQRGLEQQAREIDGGEMSAPLPESGRAALREALDAMKQGARAFERANGDAARDESGRARAALQRAIDSLRQSSPPPPSGASGDSSTEAERDRSLRDAVVEAMREGDAVEADDAVSRYYEELLE